MDAAALRIWIDGGAGSSHPYTVFLQRCNASALAAAGSLPLPLRLHASCRRQSCAMPASAASSGTKWREDDVAQAVFAAAAAAALVKQRHMRTHEADNTVLQLPSSPRC